MKQVHDDLEGPFDSDGLDDIVWSLRCSSARYKTVKTHDKTVKTHDKTVKTQHKTVKTYDKTVNCYFAVRLGRLGRHCLEPQVLVHTL